MVILSLEDASSLILFSYLYDNKGLYISILDIPKNLFNSFNKIKLE